MTNSELIKEILELLKHPDVDPEWAKKWESQKDDFTRRELIKTRNRLNKVLILS